MHDDSDINDEGDGGEEPDRQHIRPLGHGLTHLDTMIEFLRIEHGHNLEKRDCWTASAIQNMILAFLNETGNGGIADEMVVTRRSRMLRFSLSWRTNRLAETGGMRQTATVQLLKHMMDKMWKEEGASQRQLLMCSRQQTKFDRLVNYQFHYLKEER